MYKAKHGIKLQTQLGETKLKTKKSVKIKKNKVSQKKQRGPL